MAEAPAGGDEVRAAASHARPEVRPYGEWPSPITADLVVAASVSLGPPAATPGWLWWSELRPAEQGRVQLVRRALGADGRAVGEPIDVLPDGFSARTRVHEYGGGAWWVHAGVDGVVTVFFANWTDQRLYRVDRATAADAGAPVAITPEPERPGALRYADGDVTPDGRWTVCVREHHGAPGASEARNEVVAIRTAGTSEPVVLVGGEDGPEFVSHPRLRRDGGALSWLAWRHPDMPWDATELWRADVVVDGDGDVGGLTLAAAELVDGGEDVSIGQPRWVGSELWYVRDRAGAPDGDPAGRWNLTAHGWAPGFPAGRPVTATTEAEIGQPQWVFGQSSWADLHGIVAVAGRVDGVDRLGVVLDADTSLEVDDMAPTLRWADAPFTMLDGLVALDPAVSSRDQRLACIAAGFTSEPEIVVAPDLGGEVWSGRPVTTHVVRPARDLGLDPAWFSVPEHITFPTTGGAEAHALFYPPVNPGHVGPAGERPPLLVLSHGGPTGAARSQLQLSVQFWTSRGVAVVDVNYRGSVGYGRAYRDSLHDAWGVADVDDSVAAARFLAERGDIDGDRLLIRGGSAGGYTTLCALTFTDAFAAGASLYGIADLEALATDTHKFESRYLDRLVGPYPEARATYVERSPIHHTDRLATPLVVLQGLEDEVVPPAQAEMMVEALRAKGVPHAYVPFAGEQHGFRQAANIKRALEVELYFFSRVLGFTPADTVDPVPIENLDG